LPAAGALEVIEDEAPDALVDITLRDASGTTLLDQVRKLLPDVPIIIVTERG
jgi:CheY-like chemotaxis protein